MSFYVYVHTSPGGKQYVGWTSRPEARWRDHVAQARMKSNQCPAFHAAIRKYGPEAFAHEVLERMTTEAGAKRAEQLWIARLGTRVNGYNLSDGGDGCMGASWSWSEESRARASAANRGRKHSPETRAKMSEAHRAAHARGERNNIGGWARGRVRSPEHEAKRRAAVSAGHMRRDPAERSACASRAARARAKQKGN